MKKTTQRERKAFTNVVVLIKMPTEHRLCGVPLAFALTRSASRGV